MPRLLWLHGQFIPARKYQETLLLPLLSNLPDNEWEVTYLQSPRPCADPPPDTIGRMFPDIQPGEMAEWINSQSKSDGSKEYLGLSESLAFLQNYLREQPRGSTSYRRSFQRGPRDEVSWRCTWKPRGRILGSSQRKASRWNCVF
mmetsp:Transcript_26914/g.57954  ORF Transcript_26914/g.57954 Transcript_26914/m.57954 type:complete len:145 (-) Transcript_26914:521-955(-)